MNICFYTDFTMSGMTGGIGRATTVLNDFFRSNYGWKVYSIYAFEAKEDCIRAVNDGAIKLRLHDRLGMRQLAQNYQKAVEFIRQNEIQIVIVQTSMDVVSKLRRCLDEHDLHKVKVISVLHYSPGTDEFPISISELKKDIFKGKASVKNILKGIIAPGYNLLEHRATVNAYKNAYNYGETVILLSDSYIPMYQEYANLKEYKKLMAIPNCLPFEHILTSTEIKAKKNTALMVGRMVDNPKKVSTILQMWQQIEKHPIAKDWNLEIVGDGPDLDSFKVLADKLSLSRCTFTGRQNPIDYYLHSSIFFMTSEFEGFPMTLVEAQQMGCVPIAFDSFGSLKEVVVDNINGRIIPNNDTDKYIDTTIELMADTTKRMNLLICGLKDCQRFSQKNICERWKNLLESLVTA